MLHRSTWSKFLHPDDRQWQLKEFSGRLQQKLNEKGWKQSDLARRMAPMLPNSRIGRDNISKWVRGKVLPLSPHLDALCKVFECERSALRPPVPPRGGQGAGRTFTFEVLDDGTTRIRLDRIVPSKIASKVYMLLTEAA